MDDVEPFQEFRPVPETSAERLRVIRGNSAGFFQVARSFVVTLIVLGAAALSVRADDDEDDDDEPVLPGLAAHYEAASGETQIAFDRFDPLPTLLLAAGEAPDPRLPPTDWQVVWKGLLYVRSPGRYEFSARSSGKLVVRIDDKAVLEAQPGADRLATIGSSPLELGFGGHPLEVRFVQQGAGAELKLSWKSADFAIESLPVFAVGHSRKTHGDETDRFFQGRLLAEEHSCTLCHQPSPQSPLSQVLATRPGPRLTDSGSRLAAVWIFHWLDNPQAFRPEAVMPRLFPADRRGMLERHAVAAFLASRGKPPDPRRLDEGQVKNWPVQGQALFESLGCLVCHEKQGDLPARATLIGLGQKTTPEALAAFLQNPGAIDPAGRMPAFAFANGDDPLRIALYLTSRDAAEHKPLSLPAVPVAENIRGALFDNGVPQSEIDRLIKRPVDEQLHALGRQVLRVKRCTACHEIQVPGEEEFWKPLPATHDFTAIARRPRGGCSDRSRRPTHDGVPCFGPPSDQSLEQIRSNARRGQEIRDFLTQAATALGTPAPGETAKLTLERLNCTGCHLRNGQGGLAESTVARLLTNQTEQNAEAVSPPTLTGITEKLLAPSIRQVLDGQQRSRPWMGMQMPRFDAAHVGPLPAALAAADGEPLHNDPFQPPADPALIDAGRLLVGEKGFSCTKCHDMLAIASLGTRGPDLVNVPQRVTYDWYERWMTDPQRLQPGTRMPTVFFGGKSAYPHLLDGVPAQQRLAMWQYLLVCRSLPYPEGLKPPVKLQFPSSDNVQVVRTFLPDLSARAIAIRSPGGLHLAYDAQSCRLSYAWSGEFLDMRPVWDGRGGNQAAIEGAVFWTAPAGFPWEVTGSSAAVPDFSNRGSDTSLGAIAPQDGKLYPTRLNFRKLQSHPDRTTLAYELELGDDRVATFAETVATFRTELAIGITRDFVITTPLGQFVWLSAAMADQPPDWQTADGRRGRLDFGDKTAPGAAVVSFVQNGRRYVVDQRDGSVESDWLAVERGDRWSLVLRVPAHGEPPQTAIHLRLLKPIDDQPPTQARVATLELMKPKPRAAARDR